MKKHFLLLVLVPFFFACHKEKHLTGVDYLVISRQFGFIGSCEAYKITPEAVFADSARCVFVFNTPALSDDKYQIAKSLMENIPDELLDETQTAFNCENCADVGGYYIEFQQNNKVYQFSVDDLAAGVPSYLKAFNGKIQKALNDL